jgi:tRNA (guanine37-N1)-methyltransferase
MTFAATILTLYPEMFPGPLGVSLAGRAMAEGKWACETVQIRDFAEDKHRTVDDTPAGGGAGMVLKCDVLARALDHAIATHSVRPELVGSEADPQGQRLHFSSDQSAEKKDSASTSSARTVSSVVPILAMTPRGKPITQERIRELAAGPGVIILCGRFEGFDERLFEARNIEQVSIGDYILSGGEMIVSASRRLKAKRASEQE